MKRHEQLSFEVTEQIRMLGSRIRLARIRRRLGQAELATACQIGRTTLQRVEAGLPGSAIGAVYTVLWTLGLLQTASGVADPDADEQGKTLEIARSPKRVRHGRSQSDENDF